MGEAIWRHAYGHPSYLVSTDGEVYSLRRLDSLGRLVGGRLLTPVRRSKKGYLYVNIDGRMEAIHRLVLSTFVRPPKSSRELGRHRDDNNTDNRLQNLCWGTYLDNANDRRRNGGYRKRSSCIRGHSYTPENTLLTREGWQQCRTCRRERSHKAA